MYFADHWQNYHWEEKIQMLFQIIMHQFISFNSKGIVLFSEFSSLANVKLVFTLA